jgi:hypothetical protein
LEHHSGKVILMVSWFLFHRYKPCNGIRPNLRYLPRLAMITRPFR